MAEDNDKKSSKSGGTVQHFKETFNNLFELMYQPHDPAGIGVARFVFGLLMIVDIFDERGLTNLPFKWGSEEFCHFPLLHFLPRPTLEQMYAVYIVMLLSALGIMLGFLYRLSCFGFVITYWYVFLLDTTVWNNHSYLYGLISIMLLLTDAHHYWSVDGLIWPSIRNTHVPRWNYAILRFQMFILYFFAGLKKLDSDWVSGYSMSSMASHWVFDPFRLLLNTEQVNYFIVHLGGLSFDLMQGFLLLFDKTRLIGLTLGYKFHIMNAVVFHIGMFSYMSMGMITIFCRPDWPKRIISKLPKILQLFLPMTRESGVNKECNSIVSWKKCFCGLFFCYYILIQTLLPWSHSVTQGYNAWTNGLYGYSWDMMVQSWSTQHVVVQVVDAKTKKSEYLRPGAFMPNGKRGHRAYSHPNMLKDYALCIADRIKKIPEFNITEPEVYFDVWKSMNQRYQQRMFKPDVDMVKAHWSPFQKLDFTLPLLVELSGWRDTLKRIKQTALTPNTSTDIVFVADFPGYHLENYIADDIIANVTVLRGQITVEIGETNQTASRNETIALPSDIIHKIYTTSEEPACYMFQYYNKTVEGMSDEALLNSDPDTLKRKEAIERWDNMTAFGKFAKFMGKKVDNYKLGFWQMYFATSTLFDLEIGVDKDIGNYYLEKDEL